MVGRQGMCFNPEQVYKIGPWDRKISGGPAGLTAEGRWQQLEWGAVPALRECWAGSGWVGRLCQLSGSAEWAVW